MKEKLLLAIFAVLWTVGSQAQERAIRRKDSTYCVPGVLGVPRVKGVIIKQEQFLDYGIKSKGETGEITKAEIRRNRRWDFKVKAPIIIKENFKAVVGLSYSLAEFYFENPNTLTLPFHQNLEDRSLKSVKGDVVLVKPTLGRKYYILRLSAGFNGDYNSERFGEDKSEFLKYSITSLVGWKKNDYLSYAVGVSLGYNFGKKSIVPIFSYNRTFNRRWGIESVLPSSAKLRYNTLNKKSYFYFTTEFKGANYSLNLSDSQNSLIYLDTSELRLMLIWEREIHDWLWFGIESGYRKNISFDLADSPDIGSDIIIDTSLNDAFVFNLSIFIVPPRRFFE
jgi:hypothetical protein